ncbi:hypothetical protein EVAR_19972_1 [Eumeta japonica]|uniref:Uncharacterized protein n=1 Tax=Eumeta variegata TaxID=151549 RepID=A0A4C1VAU2_EUMVA|nr:hypothetical protein EVAR_19972_1 [Eumeta japonica]
MTGERRDASRRLPARQHEPTTAVVTPRTTGTATPDSPGASRFQCRKCALAFTQRRSRWNLERGTAMGNKVMAEESVMAGKWGMEGEWGDGGGVG